MREAVCTTGRRFKQESAKLARETAQRLNIPYVPRGRESMEELRERYGVPWILVAKKGRLVLDTPGGELFFHPNMAHLRLKNLRMGEGDHMVSAMGLREGMSVLDCTLGLGADAIVASYAVGPGGAVTGVEINPFVAEVIGYGLAHVLGDNYDMHEAMRRIRVCRGDYMDFLREQPADSYDVVYFDPMFRHPLLESENLNPLRSLADHRPVSGEAVREALRVARRRVVLKENSRSLEFARLGFAKMAGGQYSRIRYGILEKKHEITGT